MTQHLIIPECLFMSKKTYNALTPGQQEIVKTAGKKSTELQRKLWQERESASMDVIVASGVEVTRSPTWPPFRRL